MCKGEKELFIVTDLIHLEAFAPSLFITSLFLLAKAGNVCIELVTIA